MIDAILVFIAAIGLWALAIWWVLEQEVEEPLLIKPVRKEKPVVKPPPAPKEPQPVAELKLKEKKDAEAS